MEDPGLALSDDHAPGPHVDSALSIIDAAPVATVVAFADGRIHHLNAAAAAMFGHCPDDVIGHPIEVLVPEAARAAHVPLRRTYLRHPSRQAMAPDREVWGVRRDGTAFQAEVALTPLVLPEGPAVVASVRDVSARRLDEQRLRDLNRAYRTLAQLNQLVVRATDEEELFDGVCRICVTEGEYLGAWIGRRGEGDEVVEVAASGVFEGYVSRLDVSLDERAAGGTGPTAKVLREGVPYYSGHVPTDELVRPWLHVDADLGINALATVPLRQGGLTVAAMSLYSATAHDFGPPLRDLLEGLAENVSHALDGFHARRQLQVLAGERRALSLRLVDAQERERSRIASDVHDESIQSLAAIQLRLGLLRDQVLPLTLGDGAFTGQIHRLETEVGRIADGLRELLFELEPADADESLHDLVCSAAAHIFEHQPIEWSVHDEDGPHGSGPLVPADKGQALRIVKEALVNVRKHAGASRVRVVLRSTGGGVEVAVNDDGVGFDVGDVEPSAGHRGLANVRDRAEVSGGWSRLASGPSGTEVRFWLPYAERHPVAGDLDTP